MLALWVLDWLAVAARMAPGGRPERPEEDEPPEQAAGGPAVVGRSWVDAAAMASALVGMAVCYFLAPQWSAWYALVATSWFTLLAVPTATIVGGDERLRRELAATAPERPRWAGAPVVAARTLAGYAAILAWPAAVAAVVSRDRTLGWQEPPAAIAMLAVLAVAAATLALLADRRGWREDATLAALAALHATALAAVARVA